MITIHDIEWLREYNSLSKHYQLNFLSNFIHFTWIKFSLSHFTLPENVFLFVCLPFLFLSIQNYHSLYLSLSLLPSLILYLFFSSSTFMTLLNCNCRILDNVQLKWNERKMKGTLHRNQNNINSSISSYLKTKI